MRVQLRLAPLVLLGSALVGSALQAPAQTGEPPAAGTPGQALAFSLTIVRHDLVPAADAMPAEKYDFRPAAGEFKGVRSFAQQVKHVAAVNYALGSMVAGEKPPVEGGENGPDSVKTKAEILEYLNGSFAYLEKALASVNQKNELDLVNSPFGAKTTRLSLASFAVAHPLDHYGQMVEYLRMNRIVPPASR